MTPRWPFEDPAPIFKGMTNLRIPVPILGILAGAALARQLSRLPPPSCMQDITKARPAVSRQRSRVAPAGWAAAGATASADTAMPRAAHNGKMYCVAFMMAPPVRRP